MSENAKNCPVCGNKAIVSRAGLFAECSNNKCDLYRQVILLSRWNTRPLEDALIAERDLLREQLDVAMKAITEICELSTKRDTYAIKVLAMYDKAHSAIAEIAKLGEKK